MTPSLALSIWLSLWLQWYLPGEDLWGAEYALAAILIAGLVIGIGWSASPRWFRCLWSMAVAAPLLPAASWRLLLWAAPVLLVWAAILIVPLLVGALASRRWPGQWRRPLAVSLSVILLTLETFCSWDGEKSFWPWRAHRQELIELRHNATEAAGRLGLSTSGQMLNDEELARLSKVVPVQTTFAFPLIGRRITARVLDGGPDWLWIYFGDGRFGPLNTRTMYIPWVDD